VWSFAEPQIHSAARGLLVLISLSFRFVGYRAPRPQIASPLAYIASQQVTWLVDKQGQAGRALGEAQEAESRLVRDILLLTAAAAAQQQQLGICKQQ